MTPRQEASKKQQAATLGRLYDALQFLTEQEQLALAQLYEKDLRVLLWRFRQSVKRCADVPTTVPFYAPDTDSRKPLLDPPPPPSAIKTTHELTSCVAGQRELKVTDQPQLAMTYVDYELFPSRGAISIARRSMDLLLANANDRRPIAAEVKIRGDKNAFYALVQVLAHVADLSSVSQRERLQLHYPSLHVPREGPFADAYVIAYEPPAKGDYRPFLSSAAHRIAASVMLEPEVARHVRRVVFVDAEPGNELSFRTLFVAENHSST